jgi:nucleoside-diphosphate-sugar epimerase
MNVLVTGAGGFIGSNMVEYLIKNTDFSIYGIDNFRAGRKNEKFIRGLESERFKFFEGDFSMSESIFKNVNFHTVFHFAATPRVPYSIEYPVETNENNVTNSLLLLEFCRRSNVKRFVFSSSSSVYGDPDLFPTPENSPKNPKSPYSLQKDIIEEYCRIYSSIYDLDTVCLRYFNVYGPRQYSENAYSTVICAWMEGFIRRKEVRLDGDGLQSRDFSYVTDVCKANLLVSRQEKRFNSEAFNVACNKSANLLEIFEALSDISGNIPPINNAIERKGDVRKTHADIRKIEEIGFKYDFPLEAGIRLTYEWYKNEIMK